MFFICQTNVRERRQNQPRTEYSWQERKEVYPKVNCWEDGADIESNLNRVGPANQDGPRRARSTSQRRQTLLVCVL